MRDRPAIDQPIMGTLIHWGHTLHEPLLPPRLRARLEHNFATAHRENIDRVNLFLAGLIAEATLTLPANDHWRRLSARCGNITVGEHPPETDGALNDDSGEPFGTWRDAVDVSGFEAVTPVDDPALVALVEDLDPAAAAILAAAGHGWKAARRMIKQVQLVGDPPDADAGITSMPFLNDPDYLAAHNLSHARTAAITALRWAAHRRRAYLGHSDPWLVDSVNMWAWRATRRDLDTWGDEDVARDIEAWRIRQLGEER